MNFLKRLFGGGQGSGDSLMVYVRPKMCDQVVALRIDVVNQLSLNDSEDGYWVRKVANHPRCPFEVEVVLHFDKGKRLVNREITNGEFITEAEYVAATGQAQTGG